MKTCRYSLPAALLVAALPGVLEAQTYTWLGGQDVTGGSVGANPASNIVTNPANWVGGAGPTALNNSAIELVFGDSVQPFAYDATPYLNSAVNQIGQLTITRATNPVTSSSGGQPNPTLFVANGTGTGGGGFNGLNIANGIVQSSDADVAVVGAINFNHAGAGNFTISGTGYGNVTLGQAPGSGSGIISSNGLPVDINTTGHSSGYPEIQIAGDATNLGPVNINAGFLAVTPSGSNFQSDVKIGTGFGFTINTNTIYNYAGNMTGGGYFIKNGPGTVQLTGGANTYSGGTKIYNGTLLVNGSTQLGSGGISVYKVGKLQGSGSFSALSLTLNSGAKVLPTGILAVGQTTLNNDTYGAPRYVWPLLNASGTTAGTDWGILSINGALNINYNSSFSNKITIQPTTVNSDGNAAALTSFNPFQDYSWSLTTGASNLNMSGGFSANAFTVDTSAFQNAFGNGVFSVGLGSDGINLALNYTAATAIPEPVAEAALVGALALARAVWRRRKTQAA